MGREVNKVTPSGVEFGVRSLLGLDQELLSKVGDDGSGDTSQFNVMLAGALLKLGDLSGPEINPKHIERMLSNDRKFVLVVLRQHSLKYQKEFVFNFEWPMEEGDRNKLTQEYNVNFTAENFPVVPYKWVREEIEGLIAKEKAERPDDDEKEYVPYIKPDGHDVHFPIMFESYSEMLDEHKMIDGKMPESKLEYQWELLSGAKEKKYTKIKLKNIHANLPMEMRSPKEYFIKSGAKQDDNAVKTSLDLKRLEILDTEHFRKEIRDVEGIVDTSLSIQHPDNPLREKKIDLVSLPVFFFPSQAL